MILDLQKHLHVADFLKRGVWTYNLLKQHAGHKVLELRGAINKREDLSEYDKNYLIEAIEEIEIYLGYPIKLREALNLPITLQEMLYFRCSNLTTVDLETARADIIEKLANEEAFVTFLIEQDKWKETLKIKYPQEFGIIQEAYENSEEKPDSAMATYVAALKELTSSLLQEPEVSLVAKAK